MKQSKGAFFYSQFWNENGQNLKCAFFYSAFLFRNGQKAMPSILLPRAEWTECCEWKSKMANGEMSAADSNTSLPEKKIRLHFWTQWNIASNFIVPRKIAAITAAMAASSSATIFVKQCLLVPGPRISTGVFLCRQSELFLAFRTNHSYSRIVDKKTRPEFRMLVQNVV